MPSLFRHSRQSRNPPPPLILLTCSAGVAVWRVRTGIPPGDPPGEVIRILPCQLRIAGRAPRSIFPQNFNVPTYPGIAEGETFDHLAFSSLCCAVLSPCLLEFKACAVSGIV